MKFGLAKKGKGFVDNNNELTKSIITLPFIEEGDNSIQSDYCRQYTWCGQESLKSCGVYKNCQNLFNRFRCEPYFHYNCSGYSNS